MVVTVYFAPTLHTAATATQAASYADTYHVLSVATSPLHHAAGAGHDRGPCRVRVTPVTRASPTPDLEQFTGRPSRGGRPLGQCLISGVTSGARRPPVPADRGERTGAGQVLASTLLQRHRVPARRTPYPCHVARSTKTVRWPHQSNLLSPSSVAGGATGNSGAILPDPGSGGHTKAELARLSGGLPDCRDHRACGHARPRRPPPQNSFCNNCSSSSLRAVRRGTG